ncbi:hypothetical protein KIW84_060533 [Lathyrus oleraceus]|uniref:Uncharacterized protein n=1 Tax=Pisum sativum TaxID=3888 RepID=A0A9D4W385_PEA|nr:hypothetical protein KIW84_060533 [Pisum sativum]
MNISCHLRCAKLLSGTEAFCVYLRLMGAKIGKHCSIRAINPVSNPELMSIGAGVHLGDFSKMIIGFHSSNRYTRGRIEVQDNSVIGSQSLILPGSLVQKNVILGAPSVAPMNSKNINKVPIFWLLPLIWILSGTMAALTCGIAKWVLVGRKKKGEEVSIWSKSIILDSTWQAIRMLTGDYFMEMTCGSFMFVKWMKMMSVDVDMVMPGVRLENGANVGALSLVMK